jgi:hypothetical protein
MLSWQFVFFMFGKKGGSYMKKTVSIAALIAAFLQVAQASTITAWTFENDAVAVNNNPAPSTGSGTASSIGMATYPTPNVGVTTDDVDLGATGDTGTNGNADLTNIWRVRAQAGSAGAANGWSSLAPIGTQGAVFAASTVGYTNITVSFDWYATTQGEAKLQLQYTTDGTTWHNVPLTLSASDTGLAVMTNSSSPNTVNGSYVVITAASGGQNWFPGLTATISDPNAANNPNFAIELVNAATGADNISAAGTALNNTSGNWRFDNVSINGTSTGGTFTGFTPNNLVVSRSVYTGTASTVTPGEVLPPVCGTQATCTGVATNSGAFPAIGSTNNVWNNDAVDGSFGVTSPIFLDQITTSGTLINTLAIPTTGPDQIVTSFSSKSELALNLSLDAKYITFMGYITPPNTVDTSNSNTPGVYDPTNPVGISVSRGVAQVNAGGSLQLTLTNAYSGNNGRAAIYTGDPDGVYFSAGNDNNGSQPTTAPFNSVLTALINATGVQVVTPGATPGTPLQAGSFSITEEGDAADKPGKDNNFRGLTIFNNTLYTTKGSGSNGIDTVYQVGNAGTLPTGGGATITVLPGFPTAISKTAGANNIYPFGLWFANATTLYVADEGDGVVADAAGSIYAGLQKWSLAGGTWKLDYVLQNGLNLGTQYSVTNYPTSLNPATDGLRNITGRVNGDGTVTIWAVTSTVSANGDQGADPNLLVAVTDTLANTTAAGAASEKFTVVKAANYGEVLRGVSFTPGSAVPPALFGANVNYSFTWNGSTPQPASPVVITSTPFGVAGLTLSTAGSCAWLNASLASHTAPTSLDTSFNGAAVIELVPGSYVCNLTISGTGATSAQITATLTVSAPGFFANEVSLGGGVYFEQFSDKNLFGFFNYASSSIIFHYDMGYEGVVEANDAANGVYLYDFTSGHWWYTNPSLFPTLYDFTLNAWIYYFPSTTNADHYTSNPRYFANLTTGKIFTM